jgi:hypothetical protein
MMSFKLKSALTFFITFALFFSTFTPTAFGENLDNSTSANRPTKVNFVDQPLNFPSFFSPSNISCQKESCDWRDAKFGHGFIEYPKCELADSKNCIQSIEISTRGSEYSKLSFTSEIEWKKINIDGDSFQMKGGAPAIWSSTDLSGNTVYFLVKLFSGFGWSNSEPRLDKIEMRIASVVPAGQESATRYCLAGQSNKCYVETNFNLDSRLKVSLSVPTSLGGFFMGRMGDPVIKQNFDVNRNQNFLEITASPVTVPLMSVTIPESVTISPEVKNLIKGVEQNFPSYDGGWDEVFDFASKYSTDRVSNYSTQWSVYAMSPNSTSYATCARTVGGFIGSGTTDAMRYDFNPPAYKDGVFTFKLSGLHFKPDGVNVQLGQYDLRIKSEFARCLYNSGRVPLIANIEVTNPNGEKIVTTTSSQEADGWFKLQISALTFSTKVIKVSMSPEKPLPAAETLPAAKPASPVKTKLIQCKKGTQRKSIKGGNPQCPKGWKVIKAA